MAKIDITKIEGYDKMTPEEKLAALEAFEYEDNSSELEKYKNAASNRIEGDIQYISDRLDELQYPPGTSCKVWERSGLPTARDVKRILSNVRLIIAAYHQQADAPDVPEDMSTFSDINAVEKNLYAIKQLLDSMVDGFQKSGMFKSGTMRMLPIRR